MLKYPVRICATSIFPNWFTRIGVVIPAKIESAKMIKQLSHLIKIFVKSFTAIELKIPSSLKILKDKHGSATMLM